MRRPPPVLCQPRAHASSSGRRRLYQRVKIYSIKRVTRARRNTATTIRRSKRLIGVESGSGTTRITPAGRHRQEDARSPAHYQTNATPPPWAAAVAQRWVLLSLTCDVTESVHSSSLRSHRLAKMAMRSASTIAASIAIRSTCQMVLTADCWMIRSARPAHEWALLLHLLGDDVVLDLVVRSLGDDLLLHQLVLPRIGPVLDDLL